MTDAIRAAIQYQLNNVHTALPGQIVDYDYTVQKATVQPLLNKIWGDGTVTPMPLLTNVPIIFPRAGSASLTFPVVSGDTCLLLFCERSLDLWLSTGGQVTPDDQRKFSLTDSVAIMGLLPFSENSLADNNTDVLLTFQNSQIRIQQDGSLTLKTSSKIALGTSVTEVLDVISTLMTYLQGATVMGAAFGGPLSAGFIAQVAALQTQLNSIKGTIT